MFETDDIKLWNLTPGVKTALGKISITSEGEGLITITEKAKILNMGVRAVTKVPISHNIPGALLAHNDSRFNSYAIAEESYFGDPKSTRSEWQRFFSCCDPDL